MKVISVIITTIILCAILENFLPWWIISPTAFIVSYLFGQKWHIAFASGFLALFILWGGMAFFIDRSNEHILASRISILFTKSSQPMLIVLLTGVIGGLVAGLSAMVGALAIRKKS
jgi:hypothetical protein